MAKKKGDLDKETIKKLEAYFNKRDNIKSSNNKLK